MRIFGRTKKSGPTPTSGSSRFTYIERLEYWDQIDQDPSETATARMAYPGSEWGTARGELGDWLSQDDRALKTFQVDRGCDLTVWSGNTRWMDGEVHDLSWSGTPGHQTLTLPGSPLSVDASPDGRRVAHLSWVEGAAVLTLMDTRSGSVQVSWSFDRNELPGGSESVRWSPDSRLILVSRSTNRPPLLMDVAASMRVELPWVGGASWWPGRSPGSILLYESRDDASYFSWADLETGEGDALGSCDYPVEMPRHNDSRHVFDLDVGPDGRTFAGFAFFGVASTYNEPSAGGRGKWIAGTIPLESGDSPPRIERWSPEICWQGIRSLELDHGNVRFDRRHRTGPINLHTSLLERTRQIE